MLRLNKWRCMAHAAYAHFPTSTAPTTTIATKATTPSPSATTASSIRRGSNLARLFISYAMAKEISKHGLNFKQILYNTQIRAACVQSCFMWNWYVGWVENFICNYYINIKRSCRNPYCLLVWACLPAGNTDTHPNHNSQGRPRKQYVISRTNSWACRSPSRACFISLAMSMVVAAFMSR